MPKKIILFTLQTFSTTGGIQKMTRTLGHSLQKIASANNWTSELWSAYDNPADLMSQYVPRENFRGFGINKVKFALQALIKPPDIIILSHINLAIIGLLIKLTNPKCKVWAIAHGIEIWRPLSFIQKSLLQRCDKIICVSRYTRQQMIQRQQVAKEACVVLNNAIDPFMKLPDTFEKAAYLLERYGLNDKHRVIFTLTRMAATEKYKGYELVIEAISYLKKQFPDIRYVLSGKYDPLEDIRIHDLISQYDLSEHIILTGFIEEHELVDHFLLADLFVLPSKKEGFGIVFIEALACGLPVICGNADGSVDAIRDGELGKAINTDNLTELHACIADYLDKPLTPAKRKQLQKQCLGYFNEAKYIDQLQELLHE
ncbi:glycosyltransferase family 4 protein [Mucilaginibacter aquaedulcis]|uniref:glycosyltransferase family 4 protein n=1 Tax=Mucilaginibacter aquaedulcis TaxID=1187081 RepID=UPI0025B349D7|nr:glycosyltransferase family 4 protein [Mucilaginibacter aquaedulcis]MDN3548751.1 glycosyltransferase family 4 protein [Mucilaginibacter aquaedulcis]